MYIRNTICILILVFFATFARANDYSLELVSAGPSRGFNFPYLIRVPKADLAEEVLLIVESNNTGVSNDFSEQIESTKALATSNGLGPSIASALNSPLLIPVFPRTEREWQTYTHALDRDTILISDGPLERLDDQLLAMVDDAKIRLSDKGIAAHDRFLICGFSASGTFSNRFAFLHPESLAGVVSGAVNGIPMLPVDSISDTQLIYPIGVGDMEALTGEGFNRSVWKELPQLIFMGALDENDATLFDDGYSETERNLVHQLVGKKMMPNRWMTAQSIYMQEGANVTFITYGNLGHGTDVRVRRDLINFTKSVVHDMTR